MGSWCKIPACLDSHRSNYTHTHTSPFLPCHKSSCMTRGQITVCASVLLSERRNEIHYALIGVLIALCIGDCQTLNITSSKIILVIRWTLCFWLSLHGKMQLIILDQINCYYHRAGQTSAATLQQKCWPGYYQEFIYINSAAWHTLALASRKPHFF